MSDVRKLMERGLTEDSRPLIKERLMGHMSRLQARDPLILKVRGKDGVERESKRWASKEGLQDGTKYGDGGGWRSGDMHAVCYRVGKPWVR